MIKNYSFESFPKLNEHFKEQVSLGVYSFYLTKNDEYFLCWRNVCSCCYGDRKSIFWIVDLDGNILRQETEEFYLSEIKTIKEMIKFNIPERITKKYLKFKI